MTTARIEYVDLETIEPAAILSVVSAETVTVTGTATTESPDARPEVPAFNATTKGWARITAKSGDVIVAWGADPTASATNGVRIPQNEVVIIAVRSGQLLSFIEGA